MVGVDVEFVRVVRVRRGTRRDLDDGGQFRWRRKTICRPTATPVMTEPVPTCAARRQILVGPGSNSSVEWKSASSVGSTKLIPSAAAASSAAASKDSSPPSAFAFSGSIALHRTGMRSSRTAVDEASSISPRELRTRRDLVGRAEALRGRIASRGEVRPHRATLRRTPLDSAPSARISRGSAACDVVDHQ